MIGSSNVVFFEKGALPMNPFRPTRQTDMFSVRLYVRRTVQALAGGPSALHDLFGGRLKSALRALGHESRVEFDRALVAARTDAFEVRLVQLPYLGHPDRPTASLPYILTGEPKETASALPLTAGANDLMACFEAMAALVSDWPEVALTDTVAEHQAALFAGLEEYSVFLSKAGANTIEMVRELRAITHESLLDCLNRVRAAPSLLIEGASRDVAHRAEKAFRATGAVPMLGATWRLHPAASPPAASSDEILLARAIDVLRHERKATIPTLMRRLSIGYNHAGALIAQLEAEGVVASPGPGFARTVLVPQPAA